MPLLSYFAENSGISQRILFNIPKTCSIKITYNMLSVFVSRQLKTDVTLHKDYAYT